MNAFEQLAASLLVRAGYWVWPSYKVNLTKPEKVAIGRPSSPRWEIDLLAYKPQKNELVAVECKAYLDSGGVSIASFRNPKHDRYKLFNEQKLRDVVFHRMEEDLTASGSILKSPTIHLALMAAKVEKGKEAELEALFSQKGWLFFGAPWIREQLRLLSEGSYENDIASVAAKLLLRDANDG